MSYECNVHRRSSDGIFESTCPECAYDKERDDRRADEVKRLERQREERERHEGEQEAAAERRRGQLEKRENERHAAEREAEDERHRELLEQREREADAAERRHEEVAEVERARLAAEEARLDAEQEWREAQEREKQEESRRRELREGLPQFTDDFQQEWATVNEALVDVLQREEEFAEALTAARRSSDAASDVHTRTVTPLLDQLAIDSPKQIVGALPEAAQSGWPRLRAALAGLLDETRDNPFVRLPQADSRWVGSNSFRLWLVLRSLAGSSPKSGQVGDCRLALASYKPRPGKSALGCAGIMLVLVAPLCLLAGLSSLPRLDVAMVYGFAGVAALVPAALVAIRMVVAPRQRHNLLEALCRLDGAACAVAAKFRLEHIGSRLSPMSLGALEAEDDPEGTIRRRFGGLEHVFGVWIGVESGKWLPALLPTLGAHAAELARANLSALARWLDAARQVRDLENHTNPEDELLKGKFSFIETEIRKVGRQIVSGIRVGGPKIALVRCPACSGPLTPQVTGCPYCGSAIARA